MTAMPPERWLKLNDLFHDAVARDAAERPAFLAEACGADTALQAEVERLLRAHEAATSLTPRLGLPDDALVDDQPSLAGRTLGPYEVVREIGRGGMGAVYLAVRADREYEKRVAIKLVKRGMDTEALLKEFRRERQILAGLDHPNIARLLDGGATEDGRPYLVMEFIEGERIDEYCDARKLPVRARLTLFREVCAAVAYAHQHLVIHRDIKPSNILVGPDGAPKLLDFGIARIMHDDGTLATVGTQTGPARVTPEYASLEQLQGHPTTTLSDVYSLGVVLYELLSGQRPYRFTSRLPADVAGTIATGEPRKPSEAVAEGALGAPEGPERLRRRLRGDLDTIVLMAIRQEPARRYPSVEALSQDIARHLNGRPVVARRDTLAYRTTKFVRRNLPAVAAAALVVLSLAAGMVATRWQARRAQAQEAIAKAAQARAERRFNDVRKLARSLLFDYHDAIKSLPGATPVRERLVKDALSYLDALAREAGGDPGLQLELASAYERVGDVQGGTMVANRGDTPGAMESYRKALALYQAAQGPEARSREARRETGTCYRKLGFLIWETGDLGEALSTVRKGLALLQDLADEDPDDRDARFELGDTLRGVGTILQDEGETAGAREHLRRAREVYAALLARTPDDPRVRRALSIVLEHEGTALLNDGDLPGALSSNRQALDLRAALAAEAPINADYRRILGVSYYNEGEILDKLGRRRAALDSYRRSLAIHETLFAADPLNEQHRGDLAYTLIRVGDMLAALREVEPALASYRRSLDLRAQDVKADPTNLWKRSSLIEAHAKLAKTLAGAGRAGPALAAGRETRSLVEATPVEPTNLMFRSFFASTYADLGDAHAALGSAAETPAPERAERWRAARDMYARSLEIWLDLRTRGILGKIDEGKPAAVEHAISRCDRMLGR